MDAALDYKSRKGNMRWSSLIFKFLCYKKRVLSMSNNDTRNFSSYS